ncbi:hypothetical protein DXG03_003405 [Asterophora parasitica]|uniref:Uncharacterized protein n=1 Tax=Asterophora parasitica TaxID=117018 RepID=A0A9P7G504_9AGAR|nr:hypothetical protein DXG03_003405 [Asterophora parasitica]
MRICKVKTLAFKNPKLQRDRPKVQITSESFLCLDSWPDGTPRISKASLPMLDDSPSMGSIGAPLHPTEEILAFRYLEVPKELLTVVKRPMIMWTETYLDIWHDGPSSQLQSRFPISGAVCPASASVLATRTFVGILLREINPGGKPSSYFFMHKRDRSESAAVPLNLEALIVAEGDTMSSFSFLHEDSSTVITTNPDNFCLDLWTLVGDALQKTAVLLLPGLSASVKQCVHLECAPLDTFESPRARQMRLGSGQNTSLIVGFNLAFHHVSHFTGQVVVLTDFALSFSRQRFITYPVVLRWLSWGPKNARISPGKSDCNPFSGFFYTKQIGDLMSVYAVGDRPLSANKFMPIKRKRGSSQQFYPVFANDAPSGVLDDSELIGRATHKCDWLFYYESWVYAFTRDRDTGVYTVNICYLRDSKVVNELVQKINKESA